MIKFEKWEKISAKDCDLFYFNKLKSFIKSPIRIFFLKAKKKCIRGNHAHKICNQFFISIDKPVKILIDSGKLRKKILLKPGKILKIKPYVWVKIILEKNQSICVLCDKKYSKNEYIRNYSEFKKLRS